MSELSSEMTFVEQPANEKEAVNYDEQDQEDDEDGDGQVDALMRELYQDAEAIHDWAEFQMNQEADVKVDGAKSDPWTDKEAEQIDSDEAYKQEMSNTWASILQKKEQRSDGPSDELLGFLKAKEASSGKRMMSSSVRTSGNQWQEAYAVAEAAEPIVEVLTSGGDAADMPYIVKEAVDATGMHKMFGSASKAQNSMISCGLRMISLAGILFMIAIASYSPDEASASDIEKFKALNEAGKEPLHGQSELILYEQKAAVALKEEMAAQNALAQFAQSSVVGSALLAQQGVSQRLCDDKFSEPSKCPMWAKQGDCQKNPSGMRDICKQSCGVCDEPSFGCHDRFKDCVYWADQGECKKNPIGMNDFCKQSCGVCHINGAAVSAAKPSASADTSETEEQKLARMRKEIIEKEHGVQKVLSEAVKDAQEGKVKDAAEAMLVKKMLQKEKDQEIDLYKKEEAKAHDKKAQDTDEEPTDKGKISTEPLTKEEEEVFRQAAELEKSEAAEKASKDFNQAKGKVNQLLDSHAECLNWAQAGECQANSQWMMGNCARSCVGHMLNLKNEEKIDAHGDCATWAASGECKNNAEWMNLNCQKSCSEAAVAPEPEEPVIAAPTRGRKIVDEGHETHDNSIVRGRLKSTKYDESFVQEAAKGLTEHAKDEGMSAFKTRMEVHHKKAPRRAEAFTVKNNKVAQGRFKGKHAVETSKAHMADQHKENQERKQDALSSGVIKKMEQAMRPKHMA